MARVRDITDKLNFDENPCLVIKGKRIEVNADAPTMLKIMGIVSTGEVDMEHVNDAYELVFPEESRKEIEKMKLSISDWTTVVEEAMNLILEDGKGPGEH